MKVLIIGFGSIAQKHYTSLFRIDSKIKFYALRNNKITKEINNVKSIYTEKEILNFAPFDFVIISNPSFLHSDTIKIALQLKCPLFIEKPLFHELTNIDIIDEINKKNIPTYIACNLRFLDALKFAKYELIPRIKINEVNVYCGSFLPNWRSNVNYQTSYSSHSNMGGGVHLDLIHEIDYTYWFFGKPNNVSSSLRNKSTLEINAIDYANYLFEYNNFSVSIILNYYRKDYKRHIELVAEDGTYLIDLVTNSVYSYKDNSIIFESKQVIADTYFNQMKYFLDCIKKSNDKNHYMNDVNEAFEVLKICLHDVKR